MWKAVPDINRNMQFTEADLTIMKGLSGRRIYRTHCLHLGSRTSIQEELNLIYI